jgi:5'-methylthioadenosine phosphorylase
MHSLKQHDIDFVVIGGVGFNPDDYDFEDYEVSTSFGNVAIQTGNVVHHNKTLELAMIQRHANNEKSNNYHLPPHRLNYRAIIQAVKVLGVQRVIAVNSVGTMGSHQPGSFLVPDDFIDMTRSRPNTFFDSETVHVDVTQPYCPEIREKLLNAISANHFEQYSGVYICTEGPRFETAAEIRMLSSFGDVVGMTGLPEVVLARELGLCYASLCIITNRAAGLAEKKLTADEVIEMLGDKQASLRSILLDTMVSLSSHRQCGCSTGTQGARI